MKISFNQYSDFFITFYKGNYFEWRLGQAFCNIFNVVDQDIFYETDNGIASNKIIERYVM